jgi:phage terminase large subunit GpA-like protein
MRISAAMIDAGDQPTTVYRFIVGKEGRGIYAVIGTDARQKDTLRRAKRANKHGARPWTVDTFALKRIVSQRLQVDQPGPRYMHFCQPTKTGADAEYFAQFGAMTWRRRRLGGRIVLAPHQLRDRDEAIDLEVYAIAALYSLGDPIVKRLGEVAQRMAQPPDDGEEQQEEAPSPRQRTGEWLRGARRTRGRWI